MLGLRETRRVAWKRQYARRHYVGYVTVTETTVRFAGREDATGIDVTLSIPYDAISKIRVAEDAAEEVVGERSVVLELREDEPIFVRPISPDTQDLDDFARKLRQA
jgi:hypothetical protein